ncbi:sel1 repeat family protein [Selenomonas ruminantium]|uniref:sel1 repeat family protein n=1 Tax=Selenomonas ruminantium TaxID=971 RepID=UPI00047D969D|nr:sel1 repeat family protein [Selenomonas ruminantium]
MYKVKRAYRLKNYDVVVDERSPEVICEDNCAWTTAYVYRGLRNRKNPKSITELEWEQGTKLKICAEGTGAKRIVKSIVEWLYNKKSIEFDEARFLSQCMQRFADIRNECNLDEETLRRAEKIRLVEREAALVLAGCTEQGIKEIEKKLPAWEEKKRQNDYGWSSGEILDFSLRESAPVDITANRIERMCDYYREQCDRLNWKMEQVRHFEEIINGKEQLASAGDIEAMFFLAKAYETGRLCERDMEKVRAYLKMAKEAFAGDLVKKYKVWLDKAVQDSGLEMIGRLGREYIEGTFAESAKKNKDVKLKKEIKWLNQAIESGDGWAAFTKGNICYYGYGRWGERRQEAYNNYLKAAKSKESIYALEYGELCLKNGALKEEVVKVLAQALSE